MWIPMRISNSSKFTIDRTSLMISIISNPRRITSTNNHWWKVIILFPFNKKILWKCICVSTIHCLFNNIAVFVVKQTHYNIAVSNRIQLICLIFLAFLIKSREELAKHKEHLFWFDTSWILSEPCNICIENSYSIKVIS